MNVAFRRASGAVLGVLTAFNTACYAYVPVAVGVTPRVGDAVRVHLSPEGTAQLAGVLGPGVEFAEGMLSEVGPDGSVTVGVNSVRFVNGLEQFWSGQAVIRVSPAQMRELQHRELNRDKTRAAIIATTVGLAAIFALALAAGGVRGSDPSGGAQPPP